MLLYAYFVNVLVLLIKLQKQIVRNAEHISEGTTRISVFSF